MVQDLSQSTKLGVYRWLILSLIAYLLAHWMVSSSQATFCSWKTICSLALKTFFPSVAWLRLLKYIRAQTDIAALYGFEIVLNPLPDWTYKDWCKI